MERSRHGSYQGLEHYLGNNSKMVETQVDKGFVPGNKAELVSMKECRNQPRGIDLGGEIYGVKQSKAAMHRA